MSVLAVIPARFESTRFPGKPLADILGKPLIQHVYERVRLASCIDEVVIATDDQRIIDAAAHFGAKAVLTSVTARSGTERAAEVAKHHKASVIINIQGDEPLIHPDMVDQVANYLSDNSSVLMASLMTPLSDRKLIDDPNIVKVVVDKEGFALYFSRSAIPYFRSDANARKSDASDCGSEICYWKHVGLYGYQRDFLLKFPALNPTPLEQVEALEQLRALENGYRIKLLETKHDTIGVDTPEDLEKVKHILTQQGAESRASRNS